MQALRQIARREIILVVEDGDLTVHRVRNTLGGRDRDIVVCATAREALATLEEHPPSLVLASLDLPDLPGPAALQAIRDRAPGVPLLAIAGSPSVDLAVRAGRAGAAEVLVRPLNPRQLVQVVETALAERQREPQPAADPSRDRQGLDHFLTQSPRMLRVFDQIRAVAATDATALILGETGTGKELVSRAIHERSRRARRPFLAVNCGAFTESLLESELFGHEKGSFTGAAGRRRGVFELADGGTLFLDELGETSLNVQVNLLRVLEERRFRRVGGQDPVDVDVRIVAATNVALEEAVKKGRFRQDLFYRLNVFPIHLPPLRDRTEDILLLSRHFLADAAEEYGLEPPRLSPEVERAMLAYAWPGNVRQLRAISERWVIVAGGRTVTLDQLPSELAGSSAEARSGGQVSAVTVDDNLSMTDAVERATAQIEQAYLDRLLTRHKGHLQHTADAAGITRRTLYTKMKAYGLEAGRYRGR